MGNPHSFIEVAHVGLVKIRSTIIFSEYPNSKGPNRHAYVVVSSFVLMRWCTPGLYAMVLCLHGRDVDCDRLLMAECAQI